MRHHGLKNTFEIVEPERLIEERHGAVLPRPIAMKLLPSQGDRRDPPHLAIAAQSGSRLFLQDQIGHQHVDRRDCQSDRRFAIVPARDHFVTEIRQNAGEKLANFFIRLRQQDPRHRLL